MTFHPKLLGLVLVSATAANAPGCATETKATAVATYEEPPPPLRKETIASRPGYVWVHGNWVHGRRGWQWREGYYLREQPGYVYVQGRWERSGRQYVWVNGGWRSTSEIVTRRNHNHD